MTRSMSVAVVLLAVVGCSGATSEPATVAKTELEAPSPSTFAGTWRSVTPSLEFVRLSVHSKSSQQGVLAARLTLSGVAWEGDGRIKGDSLAMNMVIPGSAAPSGVIVARARDANTLLVRMRPTAAAPVDLTFVREN